jgi:phosphate starvation-inducible PhoH-like protein
MNSSKTKNAKKATATKTVSDNVSTVSFFANRELLSDIYSEDLTKIRKGFGVMLELEDNKFTISSRCLDNCRKSAIVLEKMFAEIEKLGEPVGEDFISDAIEQLTFRPYQHTKYKSIYTTHLGVEISPRTDNQELLIDTIKNNNITIAHGAAGSGKSGISIIMGLKYLMENRFDKMIIIRPMVAVGSSMGFLPGDIDEKYMPYASPITDALIDYIGEIEMENMIRMKKIIFSPVALTRGANFQNAYVMIDEAQNMSKVEILTLLTRICYNTKIVATGDESQSDRKSSEKSGLHWMTERMADMDDVGFVKMNKSDIQRHKMVGEIITAFE